MTEADVVPGFVRFPEDRPEWIRMLKGVYDFESKRLSGPGSSLRDIRRAVWTLDEAVQDMGLKDSEAQALKDLLGHLEKARQLMKIRGVGPDRFITRIAETVRLMGHTYEYWFRGRPGIDAVRWLVEEKKVPSLSVPAPEFATEVVSALSKVLGGRVGNLPQAVELVVRGVGKVLAKGPWEEASFSRFQLDATAKMLGSEFGRRAAPKTQILTAGVGSGKTIGFTLATLVSAVDGILGGESSRRCHLLVYPRTALAIDQHKIIERYVEAIDVEGLEAHLEHSSNPKYGHVREALQQVYGRPDPPPAIIVTTFETLKRRLHHPLFATKMAKHLQRVILDEVHLAEGLTGAHIAMLMSRLNQIVRPRRVIWTAASATVARPDDHAARLFGTRAEDVQVVLPNEEELTTVGLTHHVFLRPSGLISNLGALVNATSLLVHSRRDDVGARTADDKKRPKLLAFADNLDMLGRWNSDLRENERTEASPDRPHPDQAERTKWKEERLREVPYALRFHKPLQRRIEAEGGEGEAYEPVLKEWRGKDVCSRCMRGERISLGTADRATLQALSKIVYRSPHQPDDSVKAMRIRHPVFEQDRDEIGTLDLCPYLRAGACMWFPRGGDATEEIPGTRYYEWKTVARSTIHSSKREAKGKEYEGDLADIVFKDTVKRVYDVGPTDKYVPVDIVLASPSLEVGVDLPMVTESMMTKAIRNVASYRQKVGRVGREPGLDTLNVTLVTDTPVDLHYYRQPRKLVSLGRLDPIPLKDRNEAIVRCAMYLAVWDWLALRADLPEAIPYLVHPNGETEFTKRLRRCREALERERTTVAQHLSDVSRIVSPTGPEAREVIDQVIDEVDLLLRGASGTLQAVPHYPGMAVSDVIVYLMAGLRGRKVRPRLPREDLEPLYQAIEQYEALRARLNPETLGLAEPFRTLDLMAKSQVWDNDRLEKVLRDLEASAPSVTASREDVQELVVQILPKILGRLASAMERGHDPLAFAIFEQYLKLVNTGGWKATYLSTVMQSFPALDWVRREPWYVRPENLFTNPYESYAKLVGDAPQGQGSVSVSEALFGFIPGTWTYRMPQGCYKVKTGLLQVEPGGRLVADLSTMREAGNRFQRIRRSLPAPPGVADTLDIYTPVQLSLKQVKGKYLPLDRGRWLVLDWDEAHQMAKGESATGGRSPPIKIPRSFLSRWVHVDAVDGELVLPMDPDEGTLTIESTDGSPPLSGQEALKHVSHPLFGSLLEKVQWHDHLDVTEYVYSVSRSYSGAAGEGVQINFRDRFGDIGFGTEFRTEGLAVTLNPETVAATVSEIAAHMEKGAPDWSPSVLKAFKAFLTQVLHDRGGTVSPFLVDDIAGLVLDALWVGRGTVTFQGLVDALHGLSGDAQDLRRCASEYYGNRTPPSSVDAEAFGGRDVLPDDRGSEERAEKLAQTVEALGGSAPEKRPFLEGWVRRTLLNTLGIVAVTALQEFSGASDSDIGYAVGPEAWEGSTPVVFLYDRSAFGNGSTAVACRYLHILHVLRHGDTVASRLLPSGDFLSLLEEKLLQCPQFHTDMCALAMMDGGGGVTGLRGLRDVERQAHEIFTNSRSAWTKVGVQGPGEAWKLPLINATVDSTALRLGVAADDLIRATTTCWNGCPECVDRPEMLAGGLLGRYYVDKAVLDAWFATGRARTGEYITLDLRDLAKGIVKTGLGTLNRLCLDLPHRRLRSMWLPWTIGFEVDRRDPSRMVRLVLRASDVLDLRLSMEEQAGIGLGASSVGFKRLLWFDLVVTAYLDILGLLDGERKEVKLVYYDCRDVSFDDVGLSPRMVDALLTEARESKTVHQLERLSDILAWLLARGFRVSLCLDAAKSEEPPVREFLERLERTGSANLRVVTKHIEGGSMHKKALLTPVAVLKGSANLTYAGAGRNEEIIDHVFYGTPGYAQLRANMDDTFHGTELWGP